MQFFRHCFLFSFFLLCLGCAAQANSPEMNQRIERAVRVYLGDKIPPTVNIAVGARAPSSDFPNYDKVVVTLSLDQRKQDLDFLVSKDGSTLVRVTKLDLTKDPYAQIMEKIDLSGRPVRGNRDAKVTIVNFDDFQCPFCARMHAQLMSQVLKMYGDGVRIIYKDFPLVEIHPWAVHAAIDANCLAAQNNDSYWEFADYVHANQKAITGTEQKPPYTAQLVALDKAALEVAKRRNLPTAPLEACMKKPTDETVIKSMREGANLGISATPTLFVNGEKIDGAVPMPILQAMINRALRDAGQPIPMAAMKTEQPAAAPQAGATPPANSAPGPNAAPAAKAAPATTTASPK